ncbi:MAG: peptidoglycan-binding protein, partial [Methylobacteriaceae bacterium]|nr:peptidoglycan-binding protein [Methylobacteriaceae bacterium]
MARIGFPKLRPALVCLALLAGISAGQGEPALPRPADVRAAAPSAPAPASQAPQAEAAGPAKPAAPGQPQNANPVPSPSQLSGSQDNAAAPSTEASPAAATPARQAKKGAKKKPAAPVRETALSNDPTPAFEPETYAATAQAAERYARIVEAGGWPTIAKPLKPGAKGKEVAILRQRLAAEGDLEQPGAAADNWDPALTAAVKRFQFRYGLKETGIVAGATLKAMNVPAEQRLKQLSASAQRLQDVHFPFGERYVAVNIPSAAVDAVENGRTAHRYVAVVGDVEHRSPEIEAKISAVNINPTWTLPTSIIKNEIIPKMRQNPNYLS